MERAEIIKKLRLILISVLKHDKFEMRDELSASDVEGWDSLRHMVIITEIEKQFDFKFKLKELNSLKNMATLIALIEKKLSLSYLER